MATTEAPSTLSEMRVIIGLRPRDRENFPELTFLAARRNGTSEEWTGGDTRIIWDRTRPDEVDAARRLFDDLVGKRYAAFRVNPVGRKGDQVREFDPEAEKLIMAPALQGG